ncbi:MAG: hypothetical protein KatS3mg105_4158 [Gemmatales bacterium]|nr:MAG: hypothetical protein KatS3mg105_4158 [Gemmatales bacterium]
MSQTARIRKQQTRMSVSRARKFRVRRSLCQPLAIVASAFIFAAGCGWTPPGKPKLSDRYIPSDQVMDFGQLYDKHCRGCHGPDGKNGPAPPLNDPLFLAIVPDDELARVIARGRKPVHANADTKGAVVSERLYPEAQKTLMPAFSLPGVSIAENGVRGGPLTPKQVQAIVQGMRRTWGKPSFDKKELPPYLISQAPPGDAKAGQEVFQRACAGCHGADGKGKDGKAGAVNDPHFLNLMSNQALRRLVITGRPDLNMPSFRDEMGRGEHFRPLTSKEIADIVALLASWRASANAK